MAIELGLVIKAIAPLVTAIAKQQLPRHESVIRLLKQFEIDPIHSVPDFVTAYDDALVDYGVTSLQSRWQARRFRQF